MRYGTFRKSTKCFEAPAPELSRDQRVEISVLTAIEVDDRRIPVELCDLSVRGIGGKSDFALPIGAQAMVALPDIGAVPVQICWALGGAFGARFLSRIEAQEAAPVLMA